MSAAETPVIDAFALASEQAVLRGELPIARLPRLASMLINSAGKLTYEIRGRVDDQGCPGAIMRLWADLLLECQRCNSPLQFALDRTAVFRFAKSEDELGARPIEDDEFEDIVASRRMDVAQWIEDEALLSLPAVPRHASCRLPEEHVGHDPDMTEVAEPSPFAVLADLKRGPPRTH